jgi:hypothetical protein
MHRKFPNMEEDIEFQRVSGKQNIENALKKL